MAEAVPNVVQETHLICEPPSADIAILLNLGLVDRLQGMIQDAKDREIRGILLGRRDSQGGVSGRRIVIIDDFEAVESLGSELSRPNRADGNVPVGFFRSHLRKGLYLDEADFSMFREYFSGRSGVVPNVFLIARPEPASVPVAGFFYWKNGELQGRPSETQFPLDRRSLETGGYSVLRGSSMKPAEEPTPVPKNRRAKRVVYGSIGVALILATLIWAAVLRLPGRVDDASTLSLSVDRKGNALQLSWDPNAPAVRHANTGVLWITDGEKRRGLEFNSARLKTGSFLYTPESAVVNFRLDLLKVLAQGSESVHYVADRGTTSAATSPPQKANLAEATVVAPPRTPQPAAPRAEQAAARPVQPPVRPEPVVSITTQPLPMSKVREWIAKVPLVRTFQRNRYRGGQGFVPPRTVREVMPRVPARLAQELPGESRVDLKVSLDANGIVREIDLVSPGGDERLARIAVDALRQWRFEPARMHDKQIACDLLATLNFRNPASGGLLAQQE